MQRLPNPTGFHAAMLETRVSWLILHRKTTPLRVSVHGAPETIVAGLQRLAMSPSVWIDRSQEVPRRPAALLSMPPWLGVASQLVNKRRACEGYLSVETRNHPMATVLTRAVSWVFLPVVAQS